MKLFSIFLFQVIFILPMMSQVGFGLTASNDLYQWYANPTTADGEEASVGSAILNFGGGPKIWVGVEDVSFSLEAQANIGLAAFDINENKGFGALAVPIMAKINFNGLSTLSKDGRLGFSVGGGIQYTRTELYGLNEEFVEAGLKREYFRTYIVQLGYGFGLSGFAAQGFIRYGFNPDTDAKVFNVGVQYDFNFPMLKKIADPASAL